MSARAAEGVCIAALLSPPLATLAIPQEGRGLPVPGLRRLLEPGADLRRALRMLAVERAPLEDALDGLGHVQPAAAERGVERHDAVLAEPDHHLGILVAGEVVPYQEQAQRRQFGGQGEAFRQAILPSLPGAAGHRGIGRRGERRHRRQDPLEPLLEPAMQDRVGAAADRLEVHLARGRMEQGQDLAGAAPDILVRPGRGAALRLPTAARLRHRLEQTSLVLTPDRQAKRGAERVGPLDQPLFAAASGSVTVIGPVYLRLRTTTPVSHQLRPFCQLYPAACRARPTV